MDQQKNRLNLIISLIVISTFAILSLIAVLLTRKEEKPNFTIYPLSEITDIKVEGIFIQTANGLQLVDPNKSNNQTLQKIGELTADTVSPDYRSSDGSTNIKISPNGQHAAVMSPLQPTPIYDYESNDKTQTQTVTIYDLKTGQGKKFLETTGKTLISDFSWDLSSKAIGFVTTTQKKYNYGVMPMDVLMPTNHKPAKVFLNRVELTSSRIQTVEYKNKDSLNYSYSIPKLVALDNQKYYLALGSTLVTVSNGEVKDTRSGYLTNMALSNDYKTVALQGDSSYDSRNVNIYYLDNGEKQSLSLKNSDKYSSNFSLTIAPNKQGVAFITTQTNQNYDYIYDNDQWSAKNVKKDTRTIWYYDFTTQQYSEINTSDIPNGANAYDSAESLVFSPDGKKIAALLQSSDSTKPTIRYSVKIFTIADKSVQELPITTSIEGNTQLIRWQ